MLNPRKLTCTIAISNSAIAVLCSFNGLSELDLTYFAKIKSIQNTVYSNIYLTQIKDPIVFSHL